ncbi:unnamed protein product [Bubo scandiacus]
MVCRREEMRGDALLPARTTYLVLFSGHPDSTYVGQNISGLKEETVLHRHNLNEMLQGVNLEAVAGNDPHTLQISFCLLPRSFTYQEQTPIITLKLLAALWVSERRIKNKLEGYFCAFHNPIPLTQNSLQVHSDSSTNLTQEFVCP